MKRLGLNKLLLTILSLALSCTLFAQDLPSKERIQEEIHIFFVVGTTDVDMKFMGNKPSLDKLDLYLTPELIGYLDSIEVIGYGSPDGPVAKNLKFAMDRAEALKRYLIEKYPFIPESKLYVIGGGINWNGLYRAVEADRFTPGRNAVLKTLHDVTPKKSIPYNVGIKESLMKIGQGSASWEYMLKNHYPKLRTAAVKVIANRDAEFDPRASIFFREIIKPKINDKGKERTALAQDTIKVNKPKESTRRAVKDSIKIHHLRPIAFKTNLLYDLVSAINLEIEVPVAPRWSVAAEIITPWWLTNKNQYALQLQQANLEARYWFNPNFDMQEDKLKDHNPLTGWFIGLSGGIGLYDLEWNKQGYQGEFFTAGLTGGYVMPLLKNISLEFSLTAGYLQTDYRYYHAKQNPQGDHVLVKQLTGRTTWFGPTDAKVALIWYPHFTRIKKGGAK